MLSNSVSYYKNEEENVPKNTLTLKILCSTYKDLRIIASMPLTLIELPS